MTDNAGQIRLRLSTKDGDLLLPEENSIILVPTSFRRYALSTLVNNLLHSEKPIPLEFLINGSYLRTTLEEYLTSNGISSETTVSLEYVRARLPPLFVASYAHEDWVSSVDVSRPSDESRSPRILSGSYDGRLRVWNTSSKILATSPSGVDGGHQAFIKTAKFATPTQIVSGAADRTVKVWKYEETGDDTTASIRPQLDLCGHDSSVDSLAVHASSHRILSASADHSVGFWSTRKSDAPPATVVLNKRRKLNPAVSVAQRGPLAMLTSHTGPVSAVIFDSKDKTVGYSVSQDHSLRTWDLVTSTSVDIRTTPYALFSVEQMPQLQLVATGSIGRDVRLIDVRDSATTISAMTLRGHRNAVVGLARDPNSEYGLVSGSYDGTCKIWDVRSTQNSKDGVIGQSLYTINRESIGSKTAPSTGEGVRVFGVCWDSQLGILSASEDKRLQINRGDVTGAAPSKA